MIKYLRHNQNGITSLIAVMIMSLFVVVITIAMTKLMNGELRQAIDSENATKAFYAAESATEEASLAISNYLATGGPIDALDQGCDPAAQSTVPGISAASSSINNSASSMAITCRKITTEGTAEQIIKLGSSMQLNTYNGGAGGVDGITVSWDSGANGSVADSDNPSGDLNGSSWIGTPPLEMSVNRFSPTVQRSDLLQASSSMILVPCAANNAYGNCNQSYSTPASALDYQAGSAPFIQNVRCNYNVGASYRCTASIKNLVPNNFAVIRLQPRFKSVRVQVQAFGPSPGFNPVKIPNQFATIDVTAKSGDSFRRIVEAVQVRSGALPVSDAILGDDNICKDFQLVFEDPNTTFTRLGPSCPYPLAAP